jgi:hypothetical protein
MTIEEYANLEEQIDTERERVGKIGTPVNDTTFLEWKKKRDEFRKQNKDFAEKKVGLVTGMQLFKKSANLFKDDEDAAETFENENNQLDDIREEVDKLKGEIDGVKVDTELFGEENLDELDDIADDEADDEDDEKHEGIEEEEKDMDH